MKPAIVPAIVLPYLLLVAMLAGCTAPPSAATEPTGAPPATFQTEPKIVTFPDKNLESVIKEALGKTADEEILSTELTQLTELKAQNAGITDLSGIEYCTNLTVLGFWGNPISDVSPVSSLTNLTDLHLCEIQISDIHPLSSLTNLKWLAVVESPVSDISPLSALTKLTVLDLAGDEISDISPLTSPHSPT
jgi:internalin A